jgi:hypothetical protein
MHGWINGYIYVDAWVDEWMYIYAWMDGWQTDTSPANSFPKKDPQSTDSIYRSHRTYSLKLYIGFQDHAVNTKGSVDRQRTAPAARPLERPPRVAELKQPHALVRAVGALGVRPELAHLQQRVRVPLRDMPV